MLIEDYKGLKLVVWESPSGFNCGYCEVPETHPFYKVTYDERPKGFVERLDYYFDIHGGVTFTGFQDIGDGKRWFIGFDCGHSCDGVRPGSMYDGILTGHYYTPEEVLEMCKSLADQVLKYGEVPNYD